MNDNSEYEAAGPGCTRSATATAMMSIRIKYIGLSGSSKAGTELINGFYSDVIRAHKSQSIQDLDAYMM